MSSELGTLKFIKDGEIRYFEFDSTQGRAIGNLYNTIDELEENWHNHKNPEIDLCNHKEEDAEMYVSYSLDSGEGWNGKACRKCSQITKEFSSTCNTLSFWSDSREDNIFFEKPDWAH